MFLTISYYFSQFSIRLYEILKAYHDLKTAQTDHRSQTEKIKTPGTISWTVEIDELKKKLMVDNIASYSNFKDFRRRVLEPAQKEINAFTEINVAVKTVCQGKKVVQIMFDSTVKDTMARSTAEENVDALLGLPE